MANGSSLMACRMVMTHALLHRPSAISHQAISHDPGPLRQGTERRAENQADDFCITGRARLDAARFQVLVVDAPAGRRHARADVARYALRDRAQIGAWTSLQMLRQFGAVAPRQRRHRLVVEKQPSAVLLRDVATEAREPSH